MGRVKHILLALVFMAALTSATSAVIYYLILQPPYARQILFYLRDDAAAFKPLLMRLCIAVACFKLIPGIGADLFKRLFVRLRPDETKKFNDGVADGIFCIALLGVLLFVRFLM